MTRQRRTTTTRLGLVLVFGALLAASVDGRQRDDARDLRDDLRQRYDILALQNGVGLVPRDRNNDIRLIEVRDGSVSINGDTVTGRELRDRVGRDADPILRLSYLSAAEQRGLATPPATDGPQAPSAPQAPSVPGAPAPPELPDTPGASFPDIERTERRGGDVVRIMGNATIARDERVDGDVVVVMGNAYVDGEVDGEVTVVMGNLYLGAESVVRDDVNVVGGMLNRTAGSRVEGNVDNVAIGPGRVPGMRFPGFLRDTFFGRVGSLAGTVLRIGLLGLLALVVVAVGRDPIERVAERTAADPLRAGLVGFLAQLLFFPVLVITVVMLAVSIIGIPLLLLVPFALFGVMILCLVGFTGVAYRAGSWLNERFGWEGRSAYATVLAGVLVIALVTLLGRSAALALGPFSWPVSATGLFLEYLAWTLGMGAVILAWLQRRRAVSPPPLPVS